MKHIKAYEKEFICALKTTRLVALTEQDYRKKSFTRVNQIQWSEQKVLPIWLKRINFSIRLTHQVFTDSLKSNATLSKSPARRINAQVNHLFASILAVFNMEKLKIKFKLNHFTLRSKLYLNAIQSAFQELQAFKQNMLSA